MDELILIVDDNEKNVKPSVTCSGTRGFERSRRRPAAPGYPMPLNTYRT